MSALSPGRMVFLDANGKPLGGGSVAIYQPNTTTPTVTYRDQFETQQNPNPVPLDASGTAVIFATGLFSFAAYDALGNPVPGASGLVQGLVSPAMQTVTQASSLAAGLAALGGIGSASLVQLSEQTIGGSQAPVSGKAYVSSAPLTLNLPLTSGLTPGFWFWALAAGGTVTLQPQGTDKVDGNTAGLPITLLVSQSTLVCTDANGNWWLFGLNPVPIVTSVFVFNAGSAGTFTVGAGGARINYELWGGGGPGGAADATHAGGGGGGAGYCSDSIGTSAGTTFAFSVGSGGTATALGVAAAAGGTTYFGVASATGGGPGGQGSGSMGAGGSGGSALNAHKGLAGQTGGPGASAGTVAFGGQGGGTIQFGGTIQPAQSVGNGAWGIGTGGGGGGLSGASTSGGNGANGALIVQVTQF